MGYALSLNSQVLTPCKHESVNAASPVMMTLKGRLFISSDEVGDFDSDLVKKMTGGEPITARNMYSSLESFVPRFPCMELLSNKSADKNKRARFKVDSGIQRRVRGMFYDTNFEMVANAEEARTILNEREALPPEQRDLTEFEQRELVVATDGPQVREVPPPCLNAREGFETDDRKYFASFGSFMFTERYDKIMEQRGQLMLLLCELHAASEAPGGSWPKQPDIMDLWTSETLVNADDGDDAFSKWMDQSYERCGCVPSDQVRDATAPTTEELYEFTQVVVNAPTPELPTQTRMDTVAKQCEHCVAISDVIKKMRRRDMPGASNFFVQECGRGTQRQKTAQLVKKIEAVECFKSRTDLPATDKNNPNLMLKLSEPDLRVGPQQQKDVLRGLKLRAETAADKQDQKAREDRRREEEHIVAQFGDESSAIG